MSDVIGGLVGLAIGIGMVWLRAERPAISRRLSMAALILALVGVSGVLLMAFLGSRQGGDAGMAAITSVVFLGLTVGAALLISLLVGAYQALVIRANYRDIARSMLLDLVLIGLAFYFYSSIIFEPTQSARVSAWWQRESTRREARQDLYKRIPEQYRGITSAMLDEHARLRQRSGVDMPPLVPQEIESAIRNAENASAAPPVQDKIEYSDIGLARTRFQWGVLSGWAVGGLLFPWVLRRRPAPVAPPPIT